MVLFNIGHLWSSKKWSLDTKDIFGYMPFNSDPSLSLT